MMGGYAPDELSKSEAYRLAAQPRRRAALRAVIAASGKVSLNTLARAVAARECDTSPEAVDEETHRHVRLTLFHRDLPKLAEEHVIDFDRTEQTVAPGEHIDDLAPLLLSGDASG